MEAAALSLSWELPSAGQFEGDSCAVSEVDQGKEWEKDLLASCFSMHIWNLPFTVLPIRDYIHPPYSFILTTPHICSACAYVCAHMCIC